MSCANYWSLSGGQHDWRDPYLMDCGVRSATEKGKYSGKNYGQHIYEAAMDYFGPSVKEQDIKVRSAFDHYAVSILKNCQIVPRTILTQIFQGRL